MLKILKYLIKSTFSDILSTVQYNKILITCYITCKNAIYLFLNAIQQPPEHVHIVPPTPARLHISVCST